MQYPEFDRGRRRDHLPQRFAVSRSLTTGRARLRSVRRRPTRWRRRASSRGSVEYSAELGWDHSHRVNLLREPLRRCRIRLWRWSGCLQRPLQAHSRVVGDRCHASARRHGHRCTAHPDPVPASHTVPWPSASVPAVPESYLSAQIATSPDSVTWSVSSVLATGSSVSQIACSGGQCFVIGSNSGTGVIFVGNQVAGSQTWPAENLQGVTPTVLSQITCSGCHALLTIGSTSTGPVLLAGPVAATSQPWNSEPLQITTGSLTQITCSGTAACLVIGVDAGHAVIEAGPVSSAPAQPWQAESTVPGSPAVLTQIRALGPPPASPSELTPGETLFSWPVRCRPRHRLGGTTRRRPGMFRRPSPKSPVRGPWPVWQSAPPRIRPP